MRFHEFCIENASVGATASGAIATVPYGVGTVRRRANEASPGWDVENTGEWDGKSIADIEKTATRLRDKKDKTAEESRKLKAANFAIRAKRAKGKKWKGVKAKS